jgi:two-component sensor histidine kinase
MERVVSHLLPLRRQAWWVRYGGTTVLVALATILRMGLDGSLHDYSFYLFVPAIFVSALLLGHGPGYYALAVSIVLSVGLFLEPFFRLVVHEDDAIPLVLFVATSIGIVEVTEALRRVLDRTSRAEQENALLLEELEHRTKNDLQMIASVLTLQASSAADANVQEALRSAIGRIQVVARAHERLQRRDPAALVQVDEYIRDLCQGLGELLRDIRPIAVTVDADKMQLPTSVAVQLGLLTNELVTNSFKYAFPNGRGGTIRVTLKAVDETTAQLSVIDDGVGSVDESRQGLGTRLTTLLSRQLGGRITRDTAAPGCRVVVRFPVE